MATKGTIKRRWVEWVIAAAAAAASLFAVPSVCGDAIGAPMGTPVGAAGLANPAGAASAKAEPTASIPVSIGKLLIDVETGEVSARRASIEELSRSNDRRSIGALVAAMKDEDSEVRRAAMLGLWRVGRPGFDRLMLALSDDDYLVRRGACEALGLLEDARAISPLLDCLSDSNPEVRSSASWALGRLRTNRATRRLTVALRDDFPQVRREAAWSLGEIKDKQ
jgi:HEAT repeat protein